MTLLGDAVEIFKGRKALEVFDEPRPDAKRYLQIEDLRPGALPKFARDPDGVVADRGDVIIAWDGANAGTIGFGLDGFVGSTLAILRPRAEDIYAPCLGYYLRSRLNYIRASTTGATIPHVNRDALERLTIQFPHLPEQRRIAALLDEADRLRRTRRYAAQLSETFLQSVFVGMFGDPGINNRHWTVYAIEDVLDERRVGIRTGPFGSSLKRSEYVVQGIPVWGIDNVKPNEFCENDSLFISELKFKELEIYSVEFGDVLISRAGTVGRMCVAKPKMSPSIIGSNLLRVALMRTVILPEYFVALFTYFSHRFAHLKMSGDENAYSFINPSVMRLMTIPVPSRALQERFAGVVQQFERLRAQRREAERQAEHLFQTLLHRAFNGQA